MSGPHYGVVRKPEQHVADGFEQRLGVAAGKIGAANRSREERISNEEHRLLFSFLADGNAHAARTVPRGVLPPTAVPPDPQRPVPRIEGMEGWLPLHAQAEHLSRFDNALIEEVVVFM